MKNVSKLTAEKSKGPAYTLVAFKNWEKGTRVFYKDHQNSKCRKEAATLIVTIYGQTGLA